MWSLQRQLYVTPYQSPGCANVLCGARADVTDFSYMTLMDKSAVKHNMLKQQLYNNENNNEKQEWKKNNRTTIIQQSFKNENQWNTRIKQENETQQRKTTLKHSNDTQQWKTKNIIQWKNIETQECKNNRSTIIQSFNNEKPIKHTNETRQWNTTMKKHWNTAMAHSN